MQHHTKLNFCLICSYRTEFLLFTNTNYDLMLTCLSMSSDKNWHWHGIALLGIVLFCFYGCHAEHNYNSFVLRAWPTFFREKLIRRVSYWNWPTRKKNAWTLRIHQTHVLDPWSACCHQPSRLGAGRGSTIVSLFVSLLIAPTYWYGANVCYWQCPFRRMTCWAGAGRSSDNSHTKVPGAADSQLWDLQWRMNMRAHAY